MNARYKRNLFKDDSSLLTLLKKYLIFILIFISLLFISTIITGAIFFNTKDPTSKIDFASYIAMFLSTFITSFFLSKTFNQKNSLHGFIFGVIIAIISLFVSIFTNNDITFMKNVIIKCLIVLISVVSSLLGKKKTKSKHKFKR